MRKLIDLVEQASTIPDDIAEKIMSNPRVKRGVKCSASTRLWRGESEHSGSGMASYGQGIYFAASRKVAAQYGTVREISRDLLPFGCLRFDTTNDFQIWYQTAFKLMGYNDNRDVWKDYNDLSEFIRAIDPSVDGIQMFKGKDAIFVRYA